MAAVHEDGDLTPPSTPPTPTGAAQENNCFEDIFASSRSASPSRPSAQHPSDIPRLRATHTTAGYREGISVSKDPAVQPGFDEGYPLGATFGLKVGYLLGVLEGLVAAYGKDTEGESERNRVRALLLRARAGLSLERIFAEEVWKSDGTWRYHVPGEEDGNVVWKDVVGAHPAITKWEETVGDEMRRAGVEERRIEGPEWEAGRIGDDT